MRWNTEVGNLQRPSPVHLCIDYVRFQTDAQVIKDVRILCSKPEDSEWVPETPQELCGYVSSVPEFSPYLLVSCRHIFHTCFMGTTNSSPDTRARAKTLAGDIGAYHVDLNMDGVVTSLTNMFTMVTDFKPRFLVHGGTKTENLALQNIQARLRMVIAYLFAQLLPTVRKRAGGGSLLVLGSANVDEW